MKFFASKFSGKLLLLIALAVFLFFIFVRFEKELIFFEDSLEKNSDIKISPQQPFSSKFISTRSNLAEIEILLGGGKKLGNPKAVKFKLAQENCTEIEREGSAEFSYLGRKDLYRLKFSKIADSKGKKYCLILEYKPQETNAKNLQVYTLNDQLTMRPGYKNTSILENFYELNQRISQYKPWFFKHYYLWAIFISFIILSIFLVVILIIF
ncbi:MAG TPA: hypothetical protein P5232_00745 [Candidatus Moranbacteria bacterium]|nr:hypothetical protein [Candidatus Moranbacteria bacterium]